MDDLEECWQQLNFTKEDNKIVIDDAWLEEGIKKGEFSVIGKLHVERSINKDKLFGYADVKDTAKTFQKLSGMAEIEELLALNKRQGSSPI